MSKRSIVAVAAGVIAGATVVGVPALAYAGADAGAGPAGSDMGSMMDDPAHIDRMKAFMSERMSDPQMQEQMRSMMDGMGDMSDEGMGHMGDAPDGQSDPGNP
ncbi:hypothetical protein E4P39_01755 [Blastococcus sp. CT_GayMR19]|uniref:hypothetical protein n=1 Tax=Blastococcus sp. CT_GayMR19 TaxID=2559608 RepID=UPI0010747418|nr:hypothetical protein [Blastococcus sp. CT_GayMR19]TFV79391.1 hypothetical protein E4P39_01755 [Blastococcus sp. CT_GayMR19]